MQFGSATRKCLFSCKSPIRAAVYARVPRDTLIQTLADIGDLVRPPDDVFYKELQNQHRRVRRSVRR